LALHDDDPRSAAEFYRQAIAAGSKNPRAYTYSAYARLNESSTGGTDYMGAGGKNVYEAIEELRRAIQLDSGNVWAYQQLGRAFFLAQKLPEGAIAELSKGIGSTEESSQILHYRALLHRRNEQLDDYLADLKQLASYLEPSDALREKRLAQWKEAFVQILQSRITASVKAGGFDEAMSTIADAKKRDADGELTDAINHLERWVAENRDLRAIRKAAAANDWPAVLKQAQEFLATWPNSSAIPQVKKLLTQAEKAVPPI
jgi:tetratricopeptide (TPR) repeat protein